MEFDEYDDYLNSRNSGNWRTCVRVSVFARIGFIHYISFVHVCMCNCVGRFWEGGGTPKGNKRNEKNSYARSGIEN